MEGYQITLYTVESRRHRGKQLSHWLMEVMRDLKLQGATHLVAAEGIGHHHRLHSWHFVELTDRPEQITLIATAAEADALFARLAEEPVEIFYTRSPVEFGLAGGGARAH
ncbi:hypothetical protein BKK79_13680 [Cupriavidus sp. USMAA2-4]|uniref:DUF190 domain-containing protein n=1 Tax=Cupriavidus malaysiensis TaxID=367825 RepID=A0ABM6F7V6_9BURK|nr:MULTISPECIES: DUF190 domain-containing protein [Cupriavidus]AOY92706.1 hypothetical protein BKK79_13680 [Cupriavidus sp. USMAA2-4]AOZ00820.1 hypothetical protein BKK81_17360 [Cupriavidus sp. USMAHM13]AOZ07580.1 hypothetical protein BKK80_18370 [Cupriavidus malaysiensis]